MVSASRPLPIYRRSWFGFLLAFCILGLGITALEWQSPYAAFRPGPARQIEPLLVIAPEHRVDDSDGGGFFLTSVYIDDDVNWLEAATAELTGRSTLVPIAHVRPPDVSAEQLNQVNLAMLQESELAAKIVALRAAGHPVALHGEGVEVAAVAPDAAAAGQLEPGDIIVAVAGEPIQTVAELIPKVRGRPPGSAVTLTVRRSGEAARQETVTITTKPAPDAPGESIIGVAALTHNLRFDLPFPIEFNVGNLGGGSAGLMFALAIYDEITPGDLTQGHKVAGTGTITPEGRVGPIGGVREKVRSAESIGASYFLAPLGDAAEAKAAATSLTVIPIDTFEEARQALAGLGGQG